MHILCDLFDRLKGIVEINQTASAGLTATGQFSPL
jgi:hypothetical protein